MSARAVVDLDERRQSSGRTMPHNLDAEESLLGAMLLSRDAIAAAYEANVEPEVFYKPAHGHIFAAATSLYARGEPVDPVTIADELDRTNHLEEIGGSSTLIGLQARTPAIGNAGRYAAIVVELSTLRRLITVSNDIATLGYSVPEDVAGAVDEAESLLYGVRPASDVPAMRSLGDGLSGWLDVVEARALAGGAVEHPTGLVTLDEITGGLHPSRLSIFAARPGMGKTSWAASLATSVAASGRPVLFVSVEMSYEELVGRMVVAEARLEGSRVSRGKVAERDWPLITEAVGRLHPLPIEIVDTAVATLLSVRTAVRRMVSRYGTLGVIIVDYLQLMSSRGRTENRQVEVAELARGLKVLAKEMAVPVVALAQLSRLVDARADKRPMLADLRESGEIENSADQVVFIYRDEYYNPDSPDRGVAEFLVAKNRFGPQGAARVAADLSTGRWSDLTTRGAP